jgi:hypothetical protein
MSELLPEGESMRRAVRWVSDQLREDPDQRLGPLLDRAMRRFDLTPAQCERLLAFYRSEPKEA